MPASRLTADFVLLLSDLCAIRDACLQFAGHHLFVVLHRGNHNLVVLPKACTCRNRMTANYILLKTLKCINLAVDCGLAQYLGCLLEGGCRHKAVCLKGSSCN